MTTTMNNDSSAAGKSATLASRLGAAMVDVVLPVVVGIAGLAVLLNYMHGLAKFESEQRERERGALRVGSHFINYLEWNQDLAWEQPAQRVSAPRLALIVRACEDAKSNIAQYGTDKPSDFSRSHQAVMAACTGWGKAQKAGHVTYAEVGAGVQAVLKVDFFARMEGGATGVATQLPQAKLDEAPEKLKAMAAWAVQALPTSQATSEDAATGWQPAAPYRPSKS